MEKTVLVLPQSMAKSMSVPISLTPKIFLRKISGPTGGSLKFFAGKF
jgi:hypothetical protein